MPELDHDFSMFNGFLNPAVPAKNGEAGPLAEVVISGNFEKDSSAELSALKSAFQKRAEKEKARKLLAVDSEYWLCLCFQTREQKDAFIAALKVGVDSDKYLDGRKIAEALGIEMPPDPELPAPHVDQSWSGFCLD